MARYKPNPDEGDNWTPCRHCTAGPNGYKTCVHGKHSAKYDVDRQGCWNGELLDTSGDI